jgi:hypothetical protein
MRIDICTKLLSIQNRNPHPQFYLYRLVVEQSLLVELNLPASERVRYFWVAKLIFGLASNFSNSLVSKLYSSISVSRCIASFISMPGKCRTPLLSLEVPPASIEIYASTKPIDTSCPILSILIFILISEIKTCFVYLLALLPWAVPSPRGSAAPSRLPSGNCWIALALPQ